MASEQKSESSQLSQSHSPVTTDQPRSQYSTPTVGKVITESETHTTAETEDEYTALHSKQTPNPDQPSDATSPSTPDDPRSRPRQVIAVSASKGPAAFFNLARKFLVTDEFCDLSALEGAIVSAADAAHLLERSKLATIVRVQTSYVAVEPKRKRQVPSPQPGQTAVDATSSQILSVGSQQTGASGKTKPPAIRELRRARIIITVKRTASYKQWLDENPLHAAIAGDADEDDDDHTLHGESTSTDLR